MQILTISRQWLNYTGLGDQKYFHVFNKQIPRLFIRSMIFGNQIFGVFIFALVASSNLKISMEEALFPLHVSVMSGMRGASYMVLMIKSIRIGQLSENIRDVI